MKQRLTMDKTEYAEAVNRHIRTRLTIHSLCRFHAGSIRACSIPWILSLSPFLDHWRVKISYDFLAPADSFVDCRFPSAKIFGKEKGRQSAAFPLPFSWVILFYRQRRSDFKSSLGVWP